MFEALLPNKIRTLDRFALRIRKIGQSEFFQFVIKAELIIITIPMSIMKGGGGVELGIDVPNGGKNVVALPEIVSGFPP